MSTSKIESWMELAAMEQARKVWPGSARKADAGDGEASADLRELEKKLVAIIARHAPSEGVNGKLLAAAKGLRQLAYDLITISDLEYHDGYEQVTGEADKVINAAESSPASLERELAEALRETIALCETGDREWDLTHTDRFVKSRAVLRKYDEAKKVS